MVVVIVVVVVVVVVLVLVMTQPSRRRIASSLVHNRQDPRHIVGDASVHAGILAICATVAEGHEPKLVPFLLVQGASVWLAELACCCLRGIL